MNINTSSLSKKISDIKQTMKLNEGHRLFVLFLAGIVSGTLFINIINGKYADIICIYSEYLINNFNGINEIKIDKNGFFLYCIKKYFVQVLFLLAINLTSISGLFNRVLCVYKGIIISILISGTTLAFGKGGILIYLVSVFPHYLLYIPLFVYTMYFGMSIKKLIKEKRYIRVVFKGIAIEGAFILGTSFLEAYVNYTLLINIFS